MDSARRPCFITVCLWVLATTCLPCSGSPSPSLWGKKAVFLGRPCMWQLGKECVMPPLEELSVCVHLCRKIATPEWTGFVYKAPGARQVELGLAGRGGLLVAWLFGQEWSVPEDLPLEHWQNVCLTWSSNSERLRLYINGSSRLDAHVNASLSRRLAHNGTLTLGVSHNIVDGVMEFEDGKNFLGDISLFRMWGREQMAEEVRAHSCADGNVVSWDTRDWDYQRCLPEDDTSLQCAWSMFKIKMRAVIAQRHPLDKPVNSPEDIIHKWLGTIFPGNISVRDIFVSSPSQICQVGYNPSVRDTEKAQESRKMEFNSTSDKCVSCLVYVSVSPETDVGVAQNEIFGKLSLAFTSGQVTIIADPSRLSVRPIGAFPNVTASPPTDTNTTAGSPTRTTAGSPTSTTAGAPTSTTADAPTSTTAGSPTRTTAGSSTRTTTGSPTSTTAGSPTSTTAGSPTRATAGSSTRTTTGSSTRTTTGSPTSTTAGSPTRTTAGSPTRTTAGPPTRTTAGSPTSTTAGSPTSTTAGSPNRTTAGSPTRTTTGSPTRTTAGSPTSTTAGSPTRTTAGSPTRTTAGSPTRTTTGSPTRTTAGSPTSTTAGSPTSTTAGAPTSTTAGSPTRTTTGSPTRTTASETQQPSIGVPANPTGLSTTRESLDFSSIKPGITSTFYRVNMKLNMTTTVTANDPGETIQQWVQRKLGQVKMNVFNINILTSTYKVNDHKKIQELEMTAELRHEKRFRCTFQVEDADARNVTTTQTLITDLLSGNHVDEEIQVDRRDVHVSHIDPGSCPKDTHESFWGVYKWPITEVQMTKTMICEKNRGSRASRKCELDGVTEKAKWAKPNLKACKPVITISDLDKVTVTANNSADVVDMIENLLGDEGDLSDSQLATVVQKLDEVLWVSTVTTQLGGDIVNIIAKILVSNSDLSAVANEILGITDSIGDQMYFPEESLNVTVPSLALSMINVDPEQFQGLTFGVSSFLTGLVPEIFVNQAFLSRPCDGTVASISLPQSLHNFFSQGNKNKRVQFHFYGIQELFKDPATNWTLNSYVVSASVNNSNVSNLRDPVVVTLRHLKPKEKNDKVECVYWDFQKNNGSGGWDSNGCETLPSISAYQTTCQCYHLTHFGVLLDVSRTPINEADQEILTVISYLGCGVSSIFLGISLLTYVVFEKLRSDYPSKILINLSVALLGLNLVFLLDSWLSSFGSYGLCISTAATLHYFLLASFTWMGLEAVHMYFALVKVFNVYVPLYIHKFCALGWGIPLVIVSLVLAIEKDAYGSVLSEASLDSLQGPEPFCWIQSYVFFYITVVSFVLLVLVFNVVVFIVVLVQIRHMQTNKPAATGNKRCAMHDLRAVASLTILLGLTWPIAFFTWGPARVPMLYLFSVLNSLQGFFIFVFYCLMKENVRKQWRIHLCCGRFRLNDYSDWSRSMTMGSKAKQNQLVHRSPSVKSVNTSSRKISDDSTTASCSSGTPYQQGAESTVAQPWGLV
ncbi:adhesion G-protein coupled receptor G4 [Salmo salar]|uniref:Adhesion G-protein coupled receptor G4 n=1 Tax=Salmo salar TaxID=8030 RepID=A0ABM3F986_SALSA|nr:adhesion G-protein coupled receptor G4 [Salmo salar]|eukprot:XP_014067700.1 PREDICTED: adhesion G-protein coupled receptor G4-like [Salmo salar]